MSAIAHWYLLPTDRVGELTSLCAPAKRTQSDYKAIWQFLDAKTTHAGSLNASGWVTNPLLPYLEERFGVPVAAACAHPLVGVIDIESFLIIESSAVSVWGEGLKAAMANRDALEVYLADWYGDPLDAEGIEIHLLALRYLADGVSQITPQSILLFSVG